MKSTKKWLIPLAIAIFALVAIPAALAGGLAFNGTSPHQNGQDMVKELAPIDGVEIVVGESFPPQYFVHIAFGLRNGCIEPGGYEMERVGDEIHIKVFVLEPTAEDVMCAMVYGTETYTVNLGSEFEAGKTYVVLVNGERTTFTAQ